MPDSGRTETKAKFVNRNFIAPMGVLLKASWGVLRAFWAVSRPSTPLLELCRQRRWRELGGPWARSGVDSSSPTTTATTKIAVIVVDCRDCRDNHGNPAPSRLLRRPRRKRCAPVPPDTFKRARPLAANLRMGVAAGHETRRLEQSRERMPFFSEALRGTQADHSARWRNLGARQVGAGSYDTSGTQAAGSWGRPFICPACRL